MGTPNAFGNVGSDHDTSNPNVDSYYVDGVSLTHGSSPRQHIWTFASTANADHWYPYLKCPCTNTDISSSMVSYPPPFVGDNYFCDTAVASGYSYHTFYSDNPLWDGAGCGPQNTCCSFNSPPWFYKQLPQTTTDDIEVRVCRDQTRANEDIAIDVVEIYVH